VKAAKKRSASFVEPVARKGKSVGAVGQELPGSGNSGDRICWRFQHVDNEGPWGVERLEPGDLVELLNRLVAVESQTIRELFNNGEEPGKHYEAHRLPNKQAQERLTALNLGDMTRVSRLRFGGKPRLYGFLIDNVFHVLWWDREHEVWPSQKKNT
jgi:hypothetical protein